MSWYWITFGVISILSLCIFLILRRGFMKSLASRHYLLNEASSQTALDRPIRLVTWVYFFTHSAVLVVMGVLLAVYFS